MAGIAGVGYRYLRPLQLWGGLVGIVLFGLPVAAALAERPAGAVALGGDDGRR